MTDPAAHAQADQISAAYDDAMAVDRQIGAGQRVLARWTHTGHPLHGAGQVVTVTTHALRVRLEHAVQAGWGDPFPAGFEVIVPRPMSPRWSPQCGAFAAVAEYVQ